MKGHAYYIIHPYTSPWCLMEVTYVDTVQGGLLFLDTKALETFICCFTSYLHSITNILSGIQPFHKVIGKAKHNMDTTRLDDHYTEDYIQETIHIPSQAKGQHVQELSINVSQLSTVLVTQDEKGI